MEWLRTLEPHWAWIAFGFVLGALELVLPGFFLLWFAAAAIVTALVAWLMPEALSLQIAFFAVLSVIAVYAAKRWLRDNPILSDDPLLNDRGGRMVGETVTVIEAIEGGEGRVKLGDSVWSARGPDAPVGARLVVTGMHGTVLVLGPSG